MYHHLTIWYSGGHFEKTLVNLCHPALNVNKLAGLGLMTANFVTRCGKTGRTIWKSITVSPVVAHSDEVLWFTYRQWVVGHATFAPYVKCLFSLVVITFW